MYKVAYWGYSERMLSEIILSEEYDLKYVITVKERVNGEFLDVLRQHAIKYYFIQSKSDLLKLEKLLEIIECVIMYKFEFIIPTQFIHNRRFVNFHGGNLLSNRGAHAVVRSILNCDKETCLSLYELVGGIDEGILIDEYSIHIDNIDTPESLNKKMGDGISELLRRLSEYLAGNREGRLITGGTYYPKVTEKDFTIHLEDDSLEIISAKIRSQKSYRGAILYFDGRKYYVKNIINQDEINKSCSKEDCKIEIHIEKDNFSLILEESEKSGKV